MNLKKDLAEMQEWMAQAEEDYLERDFEYKSPEELESAVEEMKVRPPPGSLFMLISLLVPHLSHYTEPYGQLCSHSRTK